MEVNKSVYIDFNRYINYLLVIHAFSLPVSKALNVATTGLIILLWILEGSFKEKYIILKKYKFLIFLFLFLAFSFLSVFWNPSDKIDALLYLTKYYHFFIIPIMITSLRAKYIPWIITLFLSAIAISEIMSYGIFFEIIHYKNISPGDPSPFLGHIDYSVYLCFTLMILLNRIFKDNITFKIKLFYVVSFFIVVSNLFLNGGRTGQVLFIGSIFLFLFLKLKNKIFASIIASFLLISILYTAYNVSPNFNLRANYLANDIKNISYGDFSGSFGQRMSFWYIGSHIFIDNFLLGTGINNEVKDMHTYQEQLNIKTRNFEASPVSDVHNTFIMYAMQLGVIGLALFILMFFYLFHLDLSNKHRHLYIVFIFIFIGFSNASNTFHTLDSMVLFAMFIGLFAAISELKYKADL